MTTQESQVYISREQGDKYHSSENCPSRFKKCVEDGVSINVSLEYAEREHVHCKVCYVYVTDASVNSFYHKQVCDSVVGCEMTMIPLQRASDEHERCSDCKPAKT